MRFKYLLLAVVVVLGGILYSYVRYSDRTQPVPSTLVGPSDSATTNTLSNPGFSLIPPSFLKKYQTSVFDHDVILYCDTDVVDQTNKCDHAGLSISIYKTPEFGGACDQYQNLVVNGKASTYCDDKDAMTLSQIYVEDPSLSYAYSILAFYGDTFTKEEAIKLISSIKFSPIPKTSFTCPPTDVEFIDCMPGPGSPKTECSKEYLDWARLNCHEFGVAY